MNPHLESLKYQFDPASRVWKRENYCGIEYSDGDAVEQRIAQIVANTSDLSVFSIELATKCIDWPTRYHLSGSRANLLRPFEQKLKGKVLEIGAGCGAITRFLGECGGQVLALEGSLRRSAIAASRTRDLDNVSVLSERFDQFFCKEKFDVITLIGVLEYASLFTLAPKPALAMLQRVRSFLAPGGRLILAIENQLGLKYFAGAPEDHVGQPMYGIEGRYRDKQPQTFGRAALAALVKDAGFVGAEFFVPLPDYKFPASIITQAGLSDPGFDAAALAWQNAGRDPQLPLETTFSIERAWPEIFKNQLGLELANSFLLVATPHIYDDESPPSTLAFHFSTDRRPEFCKEACFSRSPSGTITVNYRRLMRAATAPENSSYRLSLPESDCYIHGVPLSKEFGQMMSHPGWTLEDVASFIGRYIQLLRELLAREGDPRELRSAYEKLPGRYLDAVPQNLILDADGRVAYIDAEWISESGIELGHLVLRSLLLAGGSRFALSGEKRPMTRRQFVEAVLEECRLPILPADFLRYMESEADFLEFVTGRPAREIMHSWSEEPLLTIATVIEPIVATLYFAPLGGVFSECNAICCSIIKKRGTVEFVFPESTQPLSMLRCDPSHRPGWYRIYALELRDPLGSKCWEWEFGRGDVVSTCLLTLQDNLKQGSILIYAENGDPQLLINLTPEIQQAVKSGWVLRLDIEELENNDILEVLTERDRHTNSLNQVVTARDEQITALNLIVSDKDKKLASALSENTQILHSLRESHALLQEIQTSTSWRMTSPFRLFFGKLRSFLKYIRAALLQAIRFIFRRLPISYDDKQKFKAFAFTTCAPLFRNTMAYRAWAEQRDAGLRLNNISQSHLITVNQPDEFVAFGQEKQSFTPPVRLIAFYLPQFHPIPENDAWWGRGFTEWTNVTRATPQFEGHYQPHLPADLGFYDLRISDVQRQQVELAKTYGLGGFCFYFYWFGGKTLLEHPIRQFLEHPEFDLPFCLCWANENWSRRWDGLNHEILIAQEHSAEDDFGFIEYISEYMNDPRYIRVNGKPLLLVYRPSLLPEPQETANRWRNWCRNHGIGEIYLAYTQSFEIENPAEYNFDAAIEFPPNISEPPVVTDQVVLKNPNFAGNVYDWRVLVERSRNYEMPKYPLFRGVNPSWDNEARRPGRGTIFLNSSPCDYQEWLQNACSDTVSRFENPDERLVFVNAWNEWAEGAHLEPDRRYGFAWLDATRKALVATKRHNPAHRIVIVSHDAHPHGAQFLALGMVRALKEDLKFEVETVLLGDGCLREQFLALTPVHECFSGANFEEEAWSLTNDLARRGFKRAFVNTTVSGFFGKALADAGIECVTLIHEMPGVIRNYNLLSQAKQIAESSRFVVFPAEIVAQGFAEFAVPPSARTKIRPQGLWRRNLWRFDRQTARAEIRNRLGFSADAPIVLAVGYADRRKGVDLFVKSALEILARRSDVRFIWIGHWSADVREEVDALLCKHQVGDAFRFLGYEPETAIYHAGADVYALTSREDPFPNVVLESFDAGVPVVAFAGSGGGAKMVSEVGGRVAPNGDILAFATSILELLHEPRKAADLGEDAIRHVDQHYAFRSYLFDLCNYAGFDLPRISVVVPNYNYGKYIKARLDSIRNQTVPVFELIILDDASSDDSIGQITEWLLKTKTEARLITKASNSGNVFEQWAKGVALATGDYVWFAEADDLSESDFLETVLPPMQNTDVVLSYCESQQIDDHGLRIGDNYQNYVKDISQNRWNAPYVVDGVEEIRTVMAIKNTIPNVSGVLFKRDVIAKVLVRDIDFIKTFKCAGDWVAYIRTLANGKVAFTPRAANMHRRHKCSVIGGGFGRELYEEISAVQKMVASEYELSGDVYNHADRYLAELRAQFGIREMPR